MKLSKTTTIVLVTALACSSTDEPFANSVDLRFENPPTTIHGRAFAFNVEAKVQPTGPVYAVLDSGTSSEQIITDDAICGGLVRPNYFWCGRDTTWKIYWPGGLPNGQHTLRIVAADADGGKRIAQVRFTTDVADLRYTAVPLPTVHGFEEGDALDVNNAGMATGWQVEFGPHFAVSWPSTTTVNVLDDSASQGNAINEQGLVVGQANGAAVLWTNGVKQILLASSNAVDVNKDGLVAISNSSPTPSLWQNGTVTQLPSCVQIYSPCQLARVNDAGQAVGNGRLTHAGESYPAGYKISLGPPSPPGYTAFPQGTVVALNNGGHYAGTMSGARSGLYLDSRLLAAEFGLSSATNQSGVRGLNDAGDLLVFESVTHTAFILRNGQVYRVQLSVVDQVLQDVHAINDAGWIAARVNNHAYLLKPAVP